MKTLKTRFRNLALAGALLLAGTVPAMADGEPADKTTAGISKQIEKQLSFPPGLSTPQSTEKVTVDFKVNNDGTVEVVDIATENMELKQHIKEQFAKLVLDAENTDTIYRVKISYRLL